MAFSFSNMQVETSDDIMMYVWVNVTNCVDSKWLKWINLELREHNTNNVF